MLKKSISNEDDASFAELFGNVEPIKPAKIKPRKHREKPISIPRKKEIPYIDPGFKQTVEPEETLFFARSGLQTKLLRKLKQGKLSIDAQLDLHGMNWSEAKEALDNFLQQAVNHHHRLLLIIPGKGRVLKSALNYYLRQQTAVLAFSTAQSKHGGTGALCVLISSKITHSIS